MITHPPAQASDEPMRADFEAWMISEAQRQHPVEPLTEKEKAYVLRRNVWDKESYEGHDGAWQSWKAAYALYATPRATADVERVMMDCLIALSIGYVQTNEEGDEVCADCDVDHVGPDHSPGCLVLRARAARAQIATLKP